MVPSGFQQGDAHNFNRRPKQYKNFFDSPPISSMHIAVLHACFVIIINYQASTKTQANLLIQANYCYVRSPPQPSQDRTHTTSKKLESTPVTLATMSFINSVEVALTPLLNLADPILGFLIGLFKAFLLFAITVNLDHRSNGPAPFAPKELSFIARILYYLFHRRCWELCKIHHIVLWIYLAFEATRAGGWASVMPTISGLGYWFISIWLFSGLITARETRDSI